MNKKLDDMRKVKVCVPLGSVFFSKMFSGSGPDVNINVFTTASVSVEYESEFSAAGINQTIFTLYVKTNTDMRSRTGFFVNNINVERKTAVCNIIIVGRVPQTYANLLQGGDFLNLVP